jgi:hypothetical protein
VCRKPAIYWKGYSFSPVRKAIHGSLQRICLYDYLGMPGGRVFAHAQCVVTLFPFSFPVSARSNAPVQTEPNRLLHKFVKNSIPSETNARIRLIISKLPAAKSISLQV